MARKSKKPRYVTKPQKILRKIVCHRCGLGSEAGTLIRTGKDKWMHKECPRDYMEFKHRAELIEKGKGIEETSDTDN